MLKLLLSIYLLMLNSCVALSQDQLKLMDFTVATQMPEFELIDMKTGQMYSSSLYSDSAFVLEFYFNGCPACNRNADNVKRLSREFYGNPKIQIVEVSIDCDDSSYRTWINNHDPLGPVLNACDSDLIDSLGVSAYPTTYVYAPSRREALRGVGVWTGPMYNRIKRFLDQVQ